MDCGKVCFSFCESPSRVRSGRTSGTYHTTLAVPLKCVISYVAEERPTIRFAAFGLATVWNLTLTLVTVERVVLLR